MQPSELRRILKIMATIQVLLGRPGIGSHKQERETIGTDMDKINESWRSLRSPVD